MLSIFLCTCWNLGIFFGKMSVEFLCPFLNRIVWFLSLLLSCMTSFYILDINHLSDTWFKKIFSHSVGCLFILLIVSFAVQKLFKFDVVPLVDFCFCCLCFWCHIKKIIAKANAEELLPHVFF